MLVDIYKRPEDSGDFSYLAVPDGQEIPQEVINTDWLNDNEHIELTNFDSDLFNIKSLESQIAEKGYAISNVKDYISIGNSV